MSASGGGSLPRPVGAAVRGHIEELTLATDGSSLEGIGSFAFACDRPCARISGADTQEDQAPFRMELKALDELLSALLATPRPPRRVHILVDCEAAIRALCCPSQCSLRLMAERAFQSGHTLRNRGVDWSLVWIPSHGKRSSWAPPSRVPATMEECRRLNAALQTKRLRNFARAATEARSGQAGSRRSFVPALWRRLVSML